MICFACLSVWCLRLWSGVRCTGDASNDLKIRDWVAGNERLTLSSNRAWNAVLRTSKYTLTTRGRDLLEKLTSPQLLNPFPAFHKTRRFVYPRVSWRVFSTSPKPQAEGPHLFGCPRLLIQYICSFVRNLRTRHVVVTGTHLSWNIL
jgi:hypothetical protein